MVFLIVQPNNYWDIERNKRLNYTRGTSKIRWRWKLRNGPRKRCHFALCTIFTILLTLWNSEQKNGLLVKLFCFSSDFDETCWSCSYPCVQQFHQVSSKSEEKQKKSFINSPFFCSEFQSVSRIVKIVHSAKNDAQYISSANFRFKIAQCASLLLQAWSYKFSTGVTTISE